MKERNHLLDLIHSAKGSPGIQILMAEFVGGCADAKPAKIIHDAKVSAENRPDGEPEEIDFSKLKASTAYDTEGNIYWIAGENGQRWGPRTRVDLLLHLEIAHGLPRRVGRKGGAAPAERALNWMQGNCEVDVAIELGGLVAGIHSLNGNRVLVPVARMPLVAAPGNAGPAVEFVQNLLGKGQDPEWERQWIQLIVWLKWWREGMSHPGIHRPRQFMAFVGPAGCGKSAVQSRIITPLMGDRSADAGLWLTGKTNFNSGLWDADHIVLSDATLDERPGVRKKLRDAIKELVANPFYPRHPKGGTLRTLPHRWGVSLSANDDEASATIIPEIDASTADKFSYLRCYSPLGGYPASGTVAGDAFWKAIDDSLPALASLIDGFVTPAAFADPRWGIKAWRHPAVMALVEQANPDSDVGGLLDEWLEEQQGGDTATATAVDLYATLDNWRFPSFSKTCRSPLVLAQALHRLSNVTGWKGRITSEVLREGPNRQSKTFWTLTKASVGLDPLPAEGSG